jgi:hypothetical protein
VLEQRRKALAVTDNFASTNTTPRHIPLFSLRDYATARAIEA